MTPQASFDFGADHIAANDPLFHNKLFQRSQRERGFYGSQSSKRQWRLVMERGRWACESCAARDKLEIDHRIPVAAGGDEHCLANQQVLCSRCHALKTSMDALKYGWQRTR